MSDGDPRTRLTDAAKAMPSRPAAEGSPYARAVGLIEEGWPMSDVTQMLVQAGMTDEHAEAAARHAVRMVARRFWRKGWFLIWAGIFGFLLLLTIQAAWTKKDPGFPCRGVWPAIREVVFGAMIGRGFWVWGRSRRMRGGLWREE